MKTRKAVGTKLRFEVFKRDKFICQYCGKKAPDVVLHLDHIEPVAKGGTNELVNLVTSCQDCNLGKSDRTLDDDSVVTKQHKQLAELEDRRQQMEMMVEWRKSLKDVNAESFDLLVDYINSHFDGRVLNDQGEAKLRPVHKKYNFDEILEAVDISAHQYLRWSEEGDVTPESVTNFLGKIGGICFNRRRPPVDAMISRVMGTGRYYLSYWNDRTGAMYIREYVSVLREVCGFSDDDIRSDLEKSVIPMTKTASSWTDWYSTLQEWEQKFHQASATEVSVPNQIPISGSPQTQPLTSSEVEKIIFGLDHIPQDLLSIVLPIAQKFVPDMQKPDIQDILLWILQCHADEWANHIAEPDDWPDIPDLNETVSQCVWNALDWYKLSEQPDTPANLAYWREMLIGVFDWHLSQLWHHWTNDLSESDDFMQVCRGLKSLRATKLEQKAEQPQIPQSQFQTVESERVALQDSEVEMIIDRLVAIPDSVIEFIRPMVQRFHLECADEEIVNFIQESKRQAFLKWVEDMEYGDYEQDDLPPVHPEDDVSPDLHYWLCRNRVIDEIEDGGYWLSAAAGVISSHITNAVWNVDGSTYWDNMHQIRDAFLTWWDQQTP